MSNAAATADMILTAAEQVTGAGSWHGKKVFIAAVYEALDMAGRGVSREEFGATLVSLHQARLLRLSRADLVEAMPRAMVAASEVVHEGERFHFVRID